MRKKRNAQKIVVVLVVGAMIVGFFLFFGGYGLLSRAVNIIGVPVWKTELFVQNAWGEFGGLIRSKKSLVDENKKLKSDLTTLSMKLLDRNLFFEENLHLKEVLGRSVLDRTILASVLSGPGSSVYDTFIIDVGEDFGIEKGDQVLYAGNIMIGTISDVFPHSSRVVLFSSPGELTDVLVGKEKIPTTAKGRGGGNYEIQFPHDVVVHEGDVVSLPGIMPRIIGSIEYVDAKTSDPFKQILFRDIVNPHQIRDVEVISHDRSKK